MSIGIANSFVAAQAPQGVGETAAMTLSEKKADAAFQSLKTYNEAPPSGGAERTERADAVKATPTNAPATVVDFNREKAGGEVPEYPISGPDEFARSMAQKNAETAEDPMQGQDDAELALRAADAPAVTPASADAGPEETVSQADADADDLQAVKSDQTRLQAQEAVEQASQDVRETAAEAGEARLAE